MKPLPTTPRWLKFGGWLAAALLGTTACVLVCFVERLLEGGFPWAFLILCVLQVALSVLSAVFCKRPPARRGIRIAAGVCAVLLTAAVIVIAVTWILGFRA